VTPTATFSAEARALSLLLSSSRPGKTGPQWIGPASKLSIQKFAQALSFVWRSEAGMFKKPGFSLGSNSKSA